MHRQKVLLQLSCSYEPNIPLLDAPTIMVLPKLDRVKSQWNDAQYYCNSEQWQDRQTDRQIDRDARVYTYTSCTTIEKPMHKEATDEMLH